MALAIGIVAALLGLLLAAGLWIAWRRYLQLCPHCGWIVRRVQQGWLRCPRCHKQYARHARLRPH
jgi:NADH pyrophosphatase NudC (nudix superfamily)